MEQDTLNIKLEQHITRMFSSAPHTQLVYHSLGHTKDVVRRSCEMAAAMELPQEEIDVLTAAAWFHDTGHLNGGIEQHEERSVQLMKNFFAENEASSNDFINKVANTIMATKMPHHPQNVLEEIICDADTWHFGTPEFKVTNRTVKQEYEMRGYERLTKGWRRKTVELLDAHQFFTTYAKEQLLRGKNENMLWAMSRAGDKSAALKLDEIKLQEREQRKKEKEEHSLVTRGMQTMLRLTSENHLELSSLADGKANILISVNAIIISVILSVLLRKLEVEPHLTIPTILFLASSVVTIVVAILATQPKVSSGTFTKEDIKQKRTNLLFFGNFHRASVDEYQWAMNEMMHDREYLYNSLVKDIYYLGVVLGKKYRLVRLAYMIFMFGIIASVIAFSLAVMLKDPETTVIVTNGAGAPL